MTIPAVGGTAVLSGPTDCIKGDCFNLSGPCKRKTDCQMDCELRSLCINLSATHDKNNISDVG